MNLKEMLIKEGIVKIKNKDEEPFTLKSGKKSRLFIDIKEASLNPTILNKIKDSLMYNEKEKKFGLYYEKYHNYNNYVFYDYARGKELYFDKIASVAVGGVPIASALSIGTNVSQIIIRSEKEDEETINLIKDAKKELVECGLYENSSIITRINIFLDNIRTHNRGTKSKIIGNCKDMKCILIEDVATSGGSIVNAVKAIREAGGICNDCIVIVNREEGAEELCKENNINLYSLLKKSDFGIDENIV